MFAEPTLNFGLWWMGAYMMDTVIWCNYLTAALSSHGLLIPSNRKLLNITIYPSSGHAQGGRIMMTSPNGNIFRVTGHLCGEFTGQRPVTRSFDVFFHLHLNERLSKQSWGWWFETPSCSLWRHCNDRSYRLIPWIANWVTSLRSSNDACT